MPSLRCYLTLLLLLLTPTVAAAAPAGEAHVYKKVGERELKLYVVAPPGLAGTSQPAIVFFHGGGWVGGAPTQFNQAATYFASRGMVAIQVEYRLLKEKAELPTTCIQDARSAMRWVRTHAAELRIDPRRIAAGGGSAGGHLAAFVGLADGHDDPADDLTVSPRADALVLFNPVFDNGPGGWGHQRVGDRYKEFSPAHNIRAGAPPTIVFVGSEDALLPVATVERFEAAMEKVGSRCETRVYQGQGYGFFNYGKAGGRFYYETIREADRFLGSLGWLTGPPTLTSPTPVNP